MNMFIFGKACRYRLFWL